MAAAVSNNAGRDQQHNKAVTICFAGQPLARRLLCCCNKDDVVTAPWYMGRGRPDYFPADIDIWIWGGMSLLTERIRMNETVIQGASAVFGFVIVLVINLFLWRGDARLIAIGSLFAAWACICVAAYCWRVRKINDEVVKEEISPKLRSIGYDVICYQRPWLSYYKITPIDETESQHYVVHDRYKGLEDQTTSTLMEPISFPLVSGGHCWDWQGYTHVFPPLHKVRLLDIWTWGGFVETVRGRVTQAEDESPPLIELRRLRRLRTWAYIALYGTTFYQYIVPDWYYSLILIPSVIVLLASVVLCYARFWDTLIELEPIQEIAKETIMDLRPIIQDRTGCIVDFEIKTSGSHGSVRVSQASSVELAGS
eukprot:CAMPEP_0119020622 /NCGR_PEP_ID=MMETSP1176-20130426/24426_1 /TAXON_ID=265551 /ORGANISM="Synedropsis recta cf, Strain CCMP1620" /LENGTH=366 /DNA_ID=CAMNT_0006975075 /DNA_START=12 /DNA_END=1108 /DNA_ORIENTATION=+